jgi:hypothetical protein
VEAAVMERDAPGLRQSRDHEPRNVVASRCQEKQEMGSPQSHRRSPTCRHPKEAHGYKIRASNSRIIELRC